MAMVAATAVLVWALAKDDVTTKKKIDGMMAVFVMTEVEVMAVIVAVKVVVVVVR